MFPVEPFELLGRDWGRVMNQFLNAEASAGLPAYGVDVRHDAEHLYVEAELPGFKKDEIEITLEKSLLTITAEHKPEQREAPPLQLGFDHQPTADPPPLQNRPDLAQPHRRQKTGEFDRNARAILRRQQADARADRVRHAQRPQPGVTKLLAINVGAGPGKNPISQGEAQN